MKLHENRNRKPTLTLVGWSYTNLLLAGGVVLGIILGVLFMVFVVSPLVSAGYDLVAEFWMRVREAVGTV